MSVFGIPTGRRLEGPDTPENLVGTLRVLQGASDDVVALARRNLREYAEGELEVEGERFRDRASGVELEIVGSHVDLVDPGASGATGFVVRDSLLVPLRPRGAGGRVERSQELGVMGARQVTGREPLGAAVDIY